MNLQAWDKKQAELPSSNAEARSAAALEACCARVESMGMQLFPNDVAFPALHVCLRLELVACGLWPERGPAVSDDQRVPSAMLKARVALTCLASLRCPDEALCLPAVLRLGAPLACSHRICIVLICYSFLIA